MKIKNVTFEDFIYTQPKQLTQQFCERIIDLYETHPTCTEHRYAGHVGEPSHLNNKIKQSEDINISKFAEFADEDKTLVIALKKLIQNYLDYIGSLNVGYAGQFELNYDDSGFQLQKTTPGGFYDWHHDDMGHRKYTYIFYLNDIDHEGETEFANGLKIKPEQGKGLIFPATWTYAHRGIAPKDEIKYIATGWISQLVHDHNKLEHDLELH